jgi:hypothetical protein
MFIKHVLGVDQKHPGLYGQTSAYYGTVEQLVTVNQSFLNNLEETPNNSQCP